MKKIDKLPVLTQSINVLFLLKQENHEALLKHFNSGRDSRSIAPDSLEPRGGYIYTGSTRPYKQLAANALKSISDVFGTDWNNQAGVAVYVHYPKEDVLTVSTQSITQPSQFCCAALNKDRKVTGNNILAGYGEKGKPLARGYDHYMPKASCLMIISDCLEEMRESKRGYLIEEAIDLAQEVIAITPDIINMHFKAIQTVRDGVFRVEAKKKPKQS
ncbi:MAG: hypothetical protein WAV23_03570 [Minisyncoccia bacterium]